MTVLHVIGGVRPGGGAGGYLYNLKKGIDNGEVVGVDVYSRNVSQDRSSEASPRALKMLYILIGRLLKALFNRKYFSEEETSYLSSHDYIVFHDLFMAIAAYRVKGLGKVGIMIHSPKDPALELVDKYSSFRGSLKAVMSFAENIAVRGAGFIVLPCASAIDGYSSGLKSKLQKKKLVEVASGVNALEFGKRDLFDSSAVNVLFLGRYNKDKGYDLYNDIAEACSAGGVKFYSAGGGNIASSEAVSNLGWRKDVADLLSSADVLVVPNRVAYYDLVILEALSVGTTVITTEVGGSAAHANSKGVELIPLHMAVEEISRKLCDFKKVDAVGRSEIVADFNDNHSISSMIYRYKKVFESEI